MKGDLQFKDHIYIKLVWHCMSPQKVLSEGFVLGLQKLFLFVHRFGYDTGMYGNGGYHEKRIPDWDSHSVGRCTLS